MHRLFAFHWLSKVDDDTWERLSSHLGTVWDREELMALQDSTPRSGKPQNKVFVPLSLSINPDLPDAILGKKKSGDSVSPEGEPRSSGDGLHTGMALPEGDEVVNMGELPKNEFIGLVSQAGLAKV